MPSTATHPQDVVKQFRLNSSPSEFLRFIHAPGSIIQVFVKMVDFLPDRHLTGFYEIDYLEEFLHGF